MAAESPDPNVPKKTTVRISLPTPPSAPGVPPAPPRPPSFPRPPQPMGASGAPPAPLAPPAPPSAAAPVPPAPAPAILTPAKPKTSKITSSIGPKKETTRITLPPDPKAMPKATVKLNQTAPLASPPPAPALRTSKIAVATPSEAPESETQAKNDPFMLPLTLFAFLAALIVALITFFPGAI